MLTPRDCRARYGNPQKEANMALWIVPADLAIGAIPKRIYCNKDVIGPLNQAFKNLIERGFLGELKTWDGCFNIRKMKSDISKASLHSWGVAIDINAASNGYGKKPMLSAGLVQCFTDAGFEWGGKWHTPDGMHFQLARLP